MKRFENRLVLVTGGTGFIGSFLVEALLAQGARVRIPIRARNFRALSQQRDAIEWIEGDLRDSAYCTKLVTGVDHIFHLASHRRNASFHKERCGDVAVGNVQMSIALLEALKEVGAFPSVTFFSTANVPSSYDVLRLSQGESIDGFVLGKALCESLWFTMAHQHQFPLLIVRPVGAYGPRDTFSDGSNVIPTLMSRARESTDALEVWGSGNQERGFLFVKDLVNAVLTLAEVDARGIQYIMPPDVVAMRVLAKTIRDLIRPELALRFDKSKPDGSRTLARLPMHESLRTLTWTPLEEGLKQTADWLLHERAS